MHVPDKGLEIHFFEVHEPEELPTKIAYKIASSGTINMHGSTMSRVVVYGQRSGMYEHQNACSRKMNM